VNVLIVLACAAGCLVLWILQELVGSMIVEAFWELLKWVFSPILSAVRRGLMRLLVDPHGAAWFFVLTLAGIAGAGGGVRLVFTGLGQGDAVACVGGVAAVALSLVALLWLDSAQDAAAARRGTRGLGTH
jgi:hypothetical protein